MRHDLDSLYIGGEWQEPSDGRLRTLYSPADHSPIGTAPVAGARDVDKAVAAAREAQDSTDWGRLPPNQRADILDAFSAELAKNAAERAALTSIQNGMPIHVAGLADGLAPVGLMRYHADLARRTPVEERRPRVDGKGETIVHREPIGVVAAVTPWNFPQPIAMFKIAPALAAGCSVVLKPSPMSVLGCLAIAAAADRSGLPPGALNIVTGDADVGAQLVAHDGVDRVAFTGSTEVGREVSTVCGRLLRPVSLALSGRPAAIMLDDPGLVPAARELAAAVCHSNGQTCYLSGRILVPRSRHDEVLEALVDLAASLPVGDPLDPDTRVGPMVTRDHRDRVASVIARGRNDGVLAFGGGRSPRDDGWFVEPTVLGDVSGSSATAREEVLGPVLSVIPFDTEEDAVAIANDNEFGLGGTIWTSDTERGTRLSRSLISGSVGINYWDIDIGAPYGGRRNSGLGHELGPEGFATYSRFKAVYLKNASDP